MHELMSLLAQKKEYVFVDYIDEIIYNTMVKGRKCIDENEQWIIDDESYKIVPGAYIFETMSQFGGLLLFTKGEKNEERKYNGYVYRVEKLKFMRNCQPGDTLSITAKCISRYLNIFKVKIIVEVEGKKVSTGVFNYILTEK